MKYNELIDFQPITSVIKLDSANKIDTARELVKTYIFSSALKENIPAIIIKNLEFENVNETKGIQVVGNYGTGKSHLMAVVSAIAENEDLVGDITDETIREAFSKIAGKYKVLRFEIGSDKALKDIVFYRLEKWLKQELKVNFEFKLDSKETFKHQLLEMLASFESVYPQQGLLVIIDELLEYLKSRNNQELNSDLMFLRSLGEACDKSRFRVMYGVQELLYRSPEFQFQAETLQKIEDRYSDLIITREDVAHVVKARLLRKDEHQKVKIRKHLEKFAHLFEDLQAKFNEFVDLFPIHPAYIHHFERIKYGKSQREILKTLSSKFEAMLNQEVPVDNPGLITYDSYWKELADNPSMMAIPDIRKVKEITNIVHDKLNSFFTLARANKKPIAEKLVNALAINLLSGDLEQKNGSTAKVLKEELCLVIKNINEPEFLLENIETTAKQIITATDGQFFDLKLDSQEFYLRVEGGRNYDQEIKELADTLSKDAYDQAFFDFLQVILQLSHNPYRSGFKIWEHEIEWKDKKIFRLGYIFFGNPDQRSTTQPIQQFYMYFMPLFSDYQIQATDDEVYFLMKKLSKDFKVLIQLYAAAKWLETRANSAEKSIFKKKIDELLSRARSIFEGEYISKTQVFYKGQEVPLQNFSLPPQGSSKEQLFSEVTAGLLNNFFNEKFPEHPAFKALLQPLTKNNYEGSIKSGLQKILKPQLANKAGEAILAGLGLWSPNGIETENSKYAQSILKQLKAKGKGQVLNRDELLTCYYGLLNLWYSNDFELDYRLEFLVLATLVYNGELEVTWSGKPINASNVEQLATLSLNDYYAFNHVKSPQTLPYETLRTLFKVLGLADLTTQIDKNDTYTTLNLKIKELVEKVVRAKEAASTGIACRTVKLLSEEEIKELKTSLESWRVMLDKLLTYNTPGKMKNFEYTSVQLNETFAASQKLEKIEKLSGLAAKFEKLVKYLVEAKTYVSDDILYAEMEEAITDLPAKLSKGENTEIKQYETRLNSLINRYVDYYLKSYLDYRLPKQEGFKKEVLVNSEIKKLCDILKDAEFIDPTPYEAWIQKMQGLKTASENVTREAIKVVPYQDFNPKDYLGKPKFKLKELEEELQTLFDNWVKTMHSIFHDPSVEKNIEFLDTADQKIVKDFKSETLSLTEDSAFKLRKLITELSRGIDKVELSFEEIKTSFNKPVTPDEAISLFTNLVEQLSRGKERKKVRIIVK